MGASMQQYAWHNSVVFKSCVSSFLQLLPLRHLQAFRGSFLLLLFSYLLNFNIFFRFHPRWLWVSVKSAVKGAKMLFERSEPCMLL